MAFAKNYSGRVTSENYEDDNYVFAEEKEWRFVPKIEDKPISINPEEFLSEKERHQEQISKHQISFELSDINFIVVDSNEEKDEFHDILLATGSGSTNLFTNVEIKQDILGYQNPSIDDYKIRMENKNLKREIAELKGK